MKVNHNNPFGEEAFFLEKIGGREMRSKQTFKKFITFIAVTFFLSSCSMVNEKLGLKDDNFGEEMIEKAIEMKFGVDVDLTPSTPE